MSEINRITDLIRGRRELSYSFEVTPDVQEKEVRNVTADPLFYSVTWHSKSHKCESLDIEPLQTARLLRSMQKQVLLHLSCDMLSKNYLNELLTMLQEKGICNIYLVLGEGYDPNTSEFKTTAHLIKYIREKTGQYFCIGVAGFPGCSDEKLIKTKEKVESGADFIITQAFFDSEEFVQFKQRCENIGINVPIIPGVFAFETHKQLTSFINLCKIKVSNDLVQYVEDKEKLNMPCIEITKQLIENLIDQCEVYHFHFFTLNRLQNSCTLLEQINIKQST